MQKIVKKNPVFDFLLSEKDFRILSWNECISTALFNDKFGYYNLKKQRVGGDGADFYTSASMKENVFGELIKNSAETILKKENKKISDYTFCEIGAEPDHCIIPNSTVFRLNDKKEIPNNTILISNELLDSRPFSRFVFSDSDWKEEYLKINKQEDCYKIDTVLLNPKQEEYSVIKKYFPTLDIEGFRLDISFDALNLLSAIASQNWNGILIFFDYFRSSAQLSNLPNGTARGYYQHKYSADILDDLSKRDITHSPCSEMLLDILKLHGFSNCKCVTQEKFFIENSEEKIRDIMQNGTALDPKKRELVQLLNPSLMGVDFRVIYATRL